MEIKLLKNLTEYESEKLVKFRSLVIFSKKLRMGKYSLFITLWVLYFVSILLMLGDLLLTELNIYVLGFYALTNATLLYRLFGVCWCTVIFHGLIPLAVLIFMIVVHWFDDLKAFLVSSIVIPLAIQIVLAIPLVLLRCRRDCNLQALLTGIHAHLGLMVIIIYFWTACFLLRRNMAAALLCMLYMLVYLAIILTPHLYGVTRQLFEKYIPNFKRKVKSKNDKKKKKKTKLNPEQAAPSRN
uniref:Uncharacterized protein n=1 Tax=Glossina palpalis gambiensis TaxID=67801 RepID=A0A1B0BQ28_9MUSC